MKKLTREDLYSLEAYDEMRPEYRKKMMAHKKDRVLPVGDHVTLHFEDRELMQYQVQEMLRSERIFDAEGIREELETYNALIPDGDNWKATFMIEYPDVAERQEVLSKMIGIEDRVWMQVGNLGKVYAIADEDLERDTATKTSAVHFLRFQLDGNMVSAVRAGEAISVGIDHEMYNHVLSPVPANFQNSLASDIA